jgi:hypothetical protein
MLEQHSLSVEHASPVTLQAVPVPSQAPLLQVPEQQL